MNPSRRRGWHLQVLALYSPTLPVAFQRTNNKALVSLRLMLRRTPWACRDCESCAVGFPKS